ncbi:hypothetical protein GYMLUDRAFT_708461 [Collybiopsis luxurians FD-317 M1]|nr:hypothetical protein GYMLUDRAFT_708461 [Collybiopsis luxurians FD-317 M1]
MIINFSIHSRGRVYYIQLYIKARRSLSVLLLLLLCQGLASTAASPYCLFPKSRLYALPSLRKVQHHVG